MKHNLITRSQNCHFSCWRCSRLLPGSDSCEQMACDPEPCEHVRANISIWAGAGESTGSSGGYCDEAPALHCLPLQGRASSPALVMCLAEVPPPAGCSATFWDLTASMRDKTWLPQILSLTLFKPGFNHKVLNFWIPSKNLIYLSVQNKCLLLWNVLIQDTAMKRLWNKRHEFIDLYIITFYLSILLSSLNQWFIMSLIINWARPGAGKQQKLDNEMMRMERRIKRFIDFPDANLL